MRQRPIQHFVIQFGLAIIALRTKTQTRKLLDFDCAYTSSLAAVYTASFWTPTGTTTLGAKEKVSQQDYTGQQRFYDNMASQPGSDSARQ